MEGLLVERIKDYSNKSEFDLILEMDDCEQGLGGGIRYNTGLFDRSSIKRIIKHLEVVWHKMIVSPKCPVTHISLLTEKE